MDKPTEHEFSEEELKTVSDLQADWIELGIRRLGGDLERVFAIMHGTGARGSLHCSIDPMELYEAVTGHAAAHLKKRDGK